MNLDLVVLAAGRGSRLAALGDDRPKWLLEVGDRTIADRQLEAFDLLRERRGEQARSLTVVTGHAAEAVAAVPLQPWQGLLHNPLYLPRNNWYSVLVALRSLPDDGSRVVVVNGDLCAPVPWLLAFLEACADTDEDAMLAIDFDRHLTAESMKVSRRGDLDELGTIGKHDFPGPVGEYVGMLTASGQVLKDLRAELEAFEADPACSNEWYEGAVGVSAGKGSRWHLWPTPGSTWVEIDDLDDLASAVDVVGV